MDFAQFFGGIVSGIEAKLDHKITGRRLLAYHTARLGHELYSGDKPVVWANVSAPFEIINAFPVASTYSEFIGAVLAGSEIAGEYLAKAEAAGYPTDGCSYHRALIGASIAGIIPEPVAVVAASVPCDGGLKIVSEVGRKSKAPSYFLEVPTESNRESIAYLTDQLHGLVEFLEETLGESFDKDRFKTIIQKSNQAAEILKQIYAFGEQVPAPYNHKDLKNFQIVMVPLMGTDAGIQIAEAFLNEFTERTANGTSTFNGEKLRLLWIQNRIQFPNNLLDYIAERYGANIVWDELNEVFWDPIDPDDPFPGLAKRLIESPLSSDLSRRVDVLKKRSVQYKIDGAIHPSNWGCRQSQNARVLFAEALREVDVPMMSLDVDCVDQRSFSPGQIITRLEAFCEMLKK